MSSLVVNDHEVEFQLCADALFAEYSASRKRMEELEARTLWVSTRGSLLDDPCEDSQQKIEKLKEMVASIVDTRYARTTRWRKPTAFGGQPKDGEAKASPTPLKQWKKRPREATSTEAKEEKIHFVHP